jgi:hypothetical protein
MHTRFLIYCNIRLYLRFSHVLSKSSSVNSEKCYVGSHIYLNSPFYNSGDRGDPPELCLFVQTVLLRGKKNVHKLTITRNGYLGNHQPMSLFGAISIRTVSQVEPGLGSYLGLFAVCLNHL